MVNPQCGKFFVTNFITFVFSRFRINLLAANHSIIRERTRLDVAEKSLKFPLEIMTLVASANNIGSARESLLSELQTIYFCNQPHTQYSLPRELMLIQLVEKFCNDNKKIRENKKKANHLFLF
jgi:hypothetical protein